MIDFNDLNDDLFEALASSFQNKDKKSLKKYLNLIFESDDKQLKLKDLISHERQQKLFEDNTPIGLTDMPNRLKNAFLHYGVNDTQKVLEISICELKKIPNFGRGSMLHLVDFIQNGKTISVDKIIDDYQNNIPIPKILKTYSINHKTLKQILKTTYTKDELIQTNKDRKVIEKERKFERNRTNFANNVRNKRIIEKWNSCKHTYESIAEVENITRERVRQILSKAKNVYHIPIKSTAEASQGRSEAVVDNAIDILDLKNFIFMFESGLERNEIIKSHGIQSSGLYKDIVQVLHEEKKISKLKRTVSKLKNARKAKSLDPEVQALRKTIIDLRKKGFSVLRIAKECGLSQASIANNIRDMKNEGMHVPNPANDLNIYQYSIQSQGKEFENEMGEIETYLEMGYSPSKIARIMDINSHTLLRLIVERL